MLHLGIDASNIRHGGGLTHLSQLLAAADPHAAGIDRVTVWASRATADALPQRPWLFKRSEPWMETGLVRRIIGQQFELPSKLAAEGCDVIFFPGGTLTGRTTAATATMSQNMLPFEPAQARHFGRWSVMRLKMKMLRVAQGRSFRRADGVVFLTRHAESTVSQALGGLLKARVRVPHGIEARFMQAPRPQRALADFTEIEPFRVLYVSILMPYKHQVEVAYAAQQLRNQGVPIDLRFVGETWGRYGREFGALLQRLDPAQRYLHWNGAEPFAKLHELYRDSDAFVFASSCENMPNILIEAMAAGLPIACADCGPMPEVLGRAGIYFNPEDPVSIADALRRLAQDAELRTEISHAAWQQAGTYSWARCAAETLDFLAGVARARGAPIFSNKASVNRHV